jgi:molecular chaperone Hsp33
MSNTELGIPVRQPAETGLDDAILPFAVKALDLRGRIVRLGAAADRILNAHDYPIPVAKLLGEAIVLTVMLGSALKFEGRFILQTQSDGPVRMLVVDFTAPGTVRACARFDAARVAAAIAQGEAAPGQLLGRGHLAMTIDRGPDMSRYQGLVPLEGGDLEQAAHEYFTRSEQIPTRVRLAVAEEFRAGENGPRRHWRVGGILLQFLPNSPERARRADLDPGDAPPGTAPHMLPEDEAWVEGRSLVATVDDIELLDPALSSERLAYRLFHERGVRVFRATPVAAQCSCSRHGVENMLRSFSQRDRDDMVEHGRITVTCEFCSSIYVFAPSDITSAPS